MEYEAWVTVEWRPSVCLSHRSTARTGYIDRRAPVWLPAATAPQHWAAARRSAANAGSTMFTAEFTRLNANFFFYQRDTTPARYFFGSVSVLSVTSWYWVKAAGQNVGRAKLTIHATVDVRPTSLAVHVTVRCARGSALRGSICQVWSPLKPVPCSKAESGLPVIRAVHIYRCFRHRRHSVQ